MMDDLSAPFLPISAYLDSSRDQKAKNASEFTRTLAESRALNLE